MRSIVDRRQRREVRAGAARSRRWDDQTRSRLAATTPSRQEPVIRIAIITQARLTSTRLPGKVLLPAGDRSYLDHHLDRVAQTGLPVIIATTTEAAENPIVELAERRGLPCTRGSLDDVLSRFVDAATEHEVDVIVRVTSDCPLIDAELINEGVQRYTELAQDRHTEGRGGDEKLLYVTNALDRSFPRGMDYEIFSADALRTASERAEEGFEREHVTAWLYGHPDHVETVILPRRGPDASQYRLTLDTPDDEVLLRTLITEYDAAQLSCDELVSLLDAHPELAAINRHVEQKKLGD